MVLPIVEGYRGSAADLVEEGASALFFPHGIGHMVGLGVRDAGGYLPGRPRSQAPARRFLRQHHHGVRWVRVDKLRGFV